MTDTYFDYPIQEEISIRDYLLKYKLSKTKIYKLFLDKDILVNGEYQNENYILHPKDVVRIILHEEIDYIPMEGDIDILYEDSYYLIINKPKGIIIHTDDKSKTGSLCNLVANYYKKKGYSLNIRFAHRLDMDTTGVIVFCKDILCHAYMNYYISIHEIKREYRCLVQGTPSPKEGRITYPIGSNRHDSKRMVVSKNGKEAITNYQVLYSYKGYSLVKVLLETGRTHQIRLHMSYSGYPLLGDTLYGGQNKYMDRTALHSYKIEFLHPVYESQISVSAELPLDMKNLTRGK